MDKKLLVSIKEKYGEAFYILDSNQFEKNFLELKKEFKSVYPNFNIAYSYKTNYIPKLCHIIKTLGGYAEVVSEMELELALRIGVKYNNIIWNGPIKNIDIMEDYLINGGIVNIDSLDEFKIVKELCKKNCNCVFNLGIRVNFSVGDEVISRFGIDVESPDFYEVLDEISNNENMRLQNFQCHFAKRDIKYWPQRAKGMIDLLEKTGVIPNRIDLGGGLYGKMHDDLKKQFSIKIPNYIDYAKAAASLFNEKFGNSGPELIIEPGSALVGDCMKFVGTIKTIKCIRGKYYASFMGSQKNISMTSVNPPIEVIHFSKGKKYDNIDIVGYTCIEGDVLYKNYCGELAKGDMIIISNCGSYSIVMKPPFILPNFPIIDISSGQIEVIKKAESFDDLFKTYNY